MTLLIILLSIAVYITGWIYAIACSKAAHYDDEAPFFGIFGALIGLVFIPIAIYYIEYYEPAPKKPKPIKDDHDLLNAILSHSEIDDKGNFIVGGEKLGIYNDHISVGNTMDIEFSKEALDKIRKQYLLLKITK